MQANVIPKKKEVYNKMTKLQCSVCDCANNSNNCCCRPDIDVCGKSACGQEQTACSSFEQKEKGTAENSQGCSIPNQHLDIRCEAENCVYNEAGNCNAESIEVSGSAGGNASTQSDTQCRTFKMK